MKRGEIFTVAAGGGYGSKPRPAVITQSDSFDQTSSVSLCLFTSDSVEAPIFRLAIEAGAPTGLAQRSWLMVDKVVTVRRQNLGKRLGKLSDEDMLRVNRALAVFLGLAG